MKESEDCSAGTVRYLFLLRLQNVGTWRRYKVNGNIQYLLLILWRNNHMVPGLATLNSFHSLLDMCQFKVYKDPSQTIVKTAWHMHKFVILPSSFI